MNQEICPNCGANEFIVEDGYRTCKYCNSKFEIKNIGNSQYKESSISVKTDIELLLKKCENEPWNSRKYANLILDIDPTNQKAKQYLL